MGYTGRKVSKSDFRLHQPTLTSFQQYAKLGGRLLGEGALADQSDHYATSIRRVRIPNQPRYTGCSA
jgi:hypothetical protein